MKFIKTLLMVLMPLAVAAQQQFHKITGRVTSGEGPVSYATVFIDELRASTMADAEGRFELTRIPPGRYKVNTESLGYTDQTKNVSVSDGDVKVTIYMQATTFELDEVEVMAKRAQRNKLEVNETAIEYVQPVSLQDVFVLLPGNLYKNNAMTGFSLNTSRQAGSDANTSLGVGVVADGVPMTDDGNRTQMVGVTSGTGSGDGEITSRTGINKGTDMRYISTDHIQSVEFNRGISAPKYGNLSSGLVQINSKYGVSPLRIRAKVDLKNKLIYAGKGLALGKKAGSLYLGADYLDSRDDVRDEMDKFSRFTAQAYYNNLLQLGSYKLELDAKVAQTISLNKMKKDELTYEYNEEYKADYDKTDLMAKAALTLDKSWIEKLQLTTSLTRTDDRIDRHYCVITGTPRIAPTATTPGEHESRYLPTMYYSDFYVENIPVNFYTQLTGDSRFNLARPLTLSLEYGAEFRSTKNWGDGAVILNEAYPPFPSDNTYMRPRRNYSIPAIETGAAFLQAVLNHRISENQSLKLDLGGRMTQMYNLPGDFAMNGRVLTEPRVNASYLFGKTFENNIRFGYGEENKLPTLDYLYPEKVYKDLMVLNAYTDDPAHRHLITFTSVFDVQNKDIKENKNRKIEVGYDAKYKGFELSLTAFVERSNSGFEYFTQYEPVSYTLYSKLKEGTDISGRRPEKEDYEPQEITRFMSYAKVTNSKKTVKRGLEYRLVLPKIKPLRTDVEVNGAYYRTNYGSNQPQYYYPASLVGDELYPRVGIYDTDAEDELHQFNSNFWFNTHIPRFKLIFTNFFQLVWLQTSQYKDNFSSTFQKIPYAYIDRQGEVHQVSAEELEKIKSDTNLDWYQLRRQASPLSYEKEEKPVYLLWNIKATKEFGNHVKLSFFVNGILDVHPKYMSSTSASQNREWSNPYFGMELILNLFNKKGGAEK